MQSRTILFNKPYDVLCQFTDTESRNTLADYIQIKDIYAAGRLDKDSEGLVVLTDDGRLQHRISDPRYKLTKGYWVQVEGLIDQSGLQKLRNGVVLKDGITQPAQATLIEEPKNLWPRTPPIRVRKMIPTCWLQLVIKEGRNRQVRRMTAAIGYPALRLIRYCIGDWTLGNLLPGEMIECDVTQAAGR